MEHAASLDLEDFEDPEFQDQLERARRQTSGRITLMNLLFNQAQDVVTVASLAVGLLVFAPWLIVLLVLALVPAFLGESHFNAQGYSLDFGRTPERRELDYVRQIAASVETAKEVKIFGLHGFLIDRYLSLAEAFFRANRALARKRAFWGTLLAALGTPVTTPRMRTSPGAPCAATSPSATSPSWPAASCACANCWKAC
jgi:ATP-binding cassette subfamily B protein